MEDFNSCASVLVSLDGAEGRLSKPYKMTKAAEYADMDHDSLFLQPEGYNPSGSFKDNGMATALTHAKLLKVNVSFVPRREIHLLLQRCTRPMKIWPVMCMFQRGKLLQGS